jgi:hypothetical protein
MYKNMFINSTISTKQKGNSGKVIRTICAKILNVIYIRLGIALIC